MDQDGQVYEYNTKGNIAFRSNVLDPIGTVVLIGGLGDNLFTLPYYEALATFLRKREISLVIPQLRSMPLFNLAPVDWDVEDIRCITSGIQHPLVLIGHSTGCNDILLYLESGAAPNILGVVLQAPVSDTEAVPRDSAEHNLRLIRDSDEASNYIELDGTIWLKERYISLYSIGGKEDLFSTYLSDSAYAKWKGKVPIMSVLSGKDEFCKNPPIRKFNHMGSVHMITGANHNLTDRSSQSTFFDLLDKFFVKIGFIR